MHAAGSLKAGNQQKNQKLSDLTSKLQKVCLGKGMHYLLKLCYFGQVMRVKRSLELDIMQGQGEGHRKREKPWMQWLNSIKEATGLRMEDLREAIQDMKK
jgi:hypothetical protein